MKNYSPVVSVRLAVANRVTHGRKRHNEDASAFANLASVGTERNYRTALVGFATWGLANRGRHFKNLTQEDGVVYLQTRRFVVKQATLDLDRQALSWWFKFKYPMVCSEVKTLLTHRAYTELNIQFLVWTAPSQRHALSLELLVATGSRTVDLLTIGRIDDFPKSERTWLAERFVGRENWPRYVVVSKGGLIREVALPAELAQRLEATRLDVRRRIENREGHYWQYFDLLGGQKFSQWFSRHSLRALGWSHGAHGLRHTYVQRRLLEVQCQGFKHEDALIIVSQEIGHFSTANTKTYCR
jgi:integrase